MSPTPLRKIVLIGGGGNLGPLVLRLLNNSPNLSITVLSRKSSKASFPEGTVVIRVADDYPYEELVHAFVEQDVVVSMIGVPHASKQIPMIDAAVAAGVRLFMPAEYGANKLNEKVADLPLLAEKRKVIEHLRSKENGGLSWTALATGPFLDWGLQNGFLGFDIAARKALIFDSGTARWSGTTLLKIGLATAKIIREPDKVKNRFVFVSSITTSQNEIMDALRKTTDQQWEVRRTTTEESLKEGLQKLEMGDRSGALPVVLSTFFQEGWGADFEKDVNREDYLTGLPEENLEEILQDLVV